MGNGIEMVKSNGGDAAPSSKNVVEKCSEGDTKENDVIVDGGNQWREAAMQKELMETETCSNLMVGFLNKAKR